MSQWSTICPVGESQLKLEPYDMTFFLGSCFADAISSRMARDKFPVAPNPFGAIYNPKSVSSSLDLLTGDGDGSGPELFLSPSGWSSWSYHSSFSSKDRDVAAERIRRSQELSKKEIREARFLVITLGSSRYFRLRENGMAVSNCHKMPQGMFDHVDMDVEEIVRTLSGSLDRLFAIRKDIHVIMTVSPIRYLSYGFHESQLGKSRLLLAVDAIARQYAQVEYFPAYEIVLDELRDYRFYKDDMVHPSDMAADYIYSRFAQRYFSRESQDYRLEVDKVMRMIEHRPFDSDSEAYQAMVRNILEKIGSLSQRNGRADWTKEIELCKSRLAR